VLRVSRLRPAYFGSCRYCCGTATHLCKQRRMVCLVQGLPLASSVQATWLCWWHYQPEAAQQSGAARINITEQQHHRPAAHPWV
jgi:NADH:ubiquinone oxidoreductase subunit